LETLRAFIAVPVSDEVRALVREVVGGLKWTGANVKWVEPENVHVTLKFLGNIPLQDVEGLKAALRKALGGCRVFEVTVDGVGCFPGRERAPRVVWIGLKAGMDSLREISGVVEDTCTALGFEPDKRPFKAHLTIGRVRRGSGKLRELAEAVGSAGFKPLKLRVDRVNLMRSRLSPKGPTYTVLESVDLEDS
jgi:2'-5' RNA ligase